MTTPTDASAANPPLPSPMFSKPALRRAALVIVSPLVAYALLRPLVSSDALSLAIAAAIPILYSIGLAFAQRRVDPIAGLSAVGFAVACLVSVLTGGSSLPLKLPEAFITFGIGIALVVAVLVRRPLPVSRLLRIPSADGQSDIVLGALVGCFLVLHALLHFALAVSLSTGSYLATGRFVDWGTAALGLLALAAYRRRAGNAGAQPPA